MGYILTASLAFLYLLSCQLAVGEKPCVLQANREVVTSPDAPTIPGQRSDAIRVGCTMYISGQIGHDPITDKLAPGGIIPETRQALTNLGNVLKAGGMTFKNVAVCTVYLVDLNDTDTFNRVYREAFTSKYPAKSVIQVTGLHLNARVELQVIAVDSRT